MILGKTQLNRLEILNFIIKWITQLKKNIKQFLILIRTRDESSQEKGFFKFGLIFNLNFQTEMQKYYKMINRRSVANLLFQVRKTMKKIIGSKFLN